MPRFVGDGTFGSRHKAAPTAIQAEASFGVSDPLRMNHPLLSRDVLLGLGVCLVMLAVVLRGLARNSRREAARRKEHRRGERRSADAGLSAELEQPPSWLENNLGLLANLLLLAGLLIAVAAFGRD